MSAPSPEHQRGLSALTFKLPWSQRFFRYVACSSAFALAMPNTILANVAMGVKGVKTKQYSSQLRTGAKRGCIFQQI